MGKVRQGRAYGVLRNRSRVKVRMENRKVMDMKQGSWKRKWDKGEQGSEFRYGVTWSVTMPVNLPFEILPEMFY